MSTTEPTSTEPTSTEPAHPAGGATSADGGNAAVGAVAPGPVGAEELGTLMWVDPTQLVVGINTRTEVRLSAHFVADIGERGVREPITVRRRDDGALVVRKGQRRTLAAVKAGLARVRVLLEADDDPDRADRHAQIARIVDQLGENNHRAGIGDREEVAAHQELLDLGLTAAQIARQTRTPAARIRQTTRVAASEIAAKAMARYELTLDHAAVIAEFDDGTAEGIEAVKTLTVCAAREPGRFAHAAQRARNDREDRRLLAEAYAHAREQGIALLQTDTDTGGGGDGERCEYPGARALTELRPRVEDPVYTRLSVEDHQDCPGHAVAMEVRRTWRNTEPPTVEAIAYCLDPDTHGHAPYYERHASPDTAAVAATEEEVAAAKDAARAERRRVIEGNKAWDAAVTVRREFLRSLLARKAAPNNAALFVAEAMATGGHELRRAFEGGNQLACSLLGVEVPDRWHAGKPNPLLGLLARAKAGKAAQVMLAVALAAEEDSLHRHSWREGNARPDTRAAAYMSALKNWGYTPTHVEELLIDPTTVDPTTVDRAAEDPADAGADDDTSDTDDEDGGAQNGGDEDAGADLATESAA
ncbi:ParB/RepB/Spo0J family partition protein [Pseudonocardia sp. N23]|uniref:ParB/RepB/Spo0J family partition protein n=1 Tax=Pseudonocardia sp. N23 TaxID=1987376 RepID=UPI000C037193|nr:ParB/RepB/Spo0J family partition protein [Pseudonocardia sp. N23]RTL63171.1 MAG: chromosome partitioning protein ParB [Pseudonocardiaceae bacterium]GAY08594.1 chromosome (plasmid) partitioning protein ParB [Pseudonocardia sp. N23]